MYVYYFSDSMSLRLRRKASLSMQAKTVGFQPRVARLGYGEDWLTKLVGTYPYSFNLWEVLKGVMYGGVSYGLLTAVGAPAKSPTTVAWQSFLIGGGVAGMESVIDNALCYAYGIDPCWREADISHLIHELLIGVLMQGGIAAGVAALLSKL